MTTRDLSAAPWFVIFRGDEGHRPRLRLFCFPYAGGGSSSFRTWADGLPPGTEVWAVVPPGREYRLDEPRCLRLPPLVEELTTVIGEHLGPPHLFFGHSLGALTAYEVAHRLRASGFGEPECLVVSGHRAPHLPRRGGTAHDLPDDRLIELMRRWGGVRDEVLGNREILELLLPTLRSDLEVAATYSHVPREPLSCPILALGGASDPEVSGTELAAWKQHTSGPFTQRMFPGGHFYLEREGSALSATILAHLKEGQRT